jgi:AcrR family transcriptional regulator
VLKILKMKFDSDVRLHIVLKAAKVFSAYGYNKTRMDDIAKSVDKKRSTIYYYFKNKDEVFNAVVEYEANILKTELLDAVANVDEPMAKVRNYLVTRMHVYKRVDNFYKAITNNRLLHLSYIEEIRRTYEQQEIGLLSRILDEGIEKGQIHISDSGLAAMAIVTALKGLEMHLFNNEEHSLDKKLEQLLDLLFFGIASREKMPDK